MKTGLRIWMAAAVVTTLALAGCGGGDGGQPASITAGVISKVGSITVNGVEYQTKGASLRMPDDGIGKDNPVILDQPQTQLQEGMFVVVKGNANGTTGTATDIEFMDNMEGKVNEKSGTTLNVMGQFVAVDNSTRFVDNNGNAIGFANISTGRKVKVSGLADNMGLLHATYVKQRTSSATTDQEFKGFVIDTPTRVATTLQLGLTPTAVTTAMTVNFSGLTLPSGLARGSFVAVKSTAGFNAQNEFVASSLSLVASMASEAESTQIATRELSGYISTGSAAGFTVNGQNITTNAQTAFVGGAAANIGPGKLVIVKGTLANGVITATKITFL